MYFVKYAIIIPIFDTLSLYTKEGSEVFEKRFGEKLESVPMILSADFNLNFADDRNIPVIDFFQ